MDTVFVIRKILGFDFYRSINYNLRMIKYDDECVDQNNFSNETQELHK